MKRKYKIQSKVRLSEESANKESGVWQIVSTVAWQIDWCQTKSQKESDRGVRQISELRQTDKSLKAIIPGGGGGGWRGGAISSIGLGKF